MAAKKLAKRVSSRSSLSADGCLQLSDTLSPYIDATLQKQICANLGCQLDGCPACLEFLHGLEETVRRIEKQSPLDRAPAGEIRRTILRQYRSVVKLPVKRRAASR